MLSSALQPFSGVAAPTTYQLPTGSLSIDWTNPLTIGLVGCWVPGATGAVNLAGRDPFYMGSTNAAGNVVATDTNAATPEGPGLNSPAATRQTWIALAPSDVKNSRLLSFYWRGLPVANTGDFSVLIGVTYDNNNGTPFAVNDIVITSPGWTNGVLLGANNAGAPNNVGTAQPVTLNVMIGIGATFNQLGGGRAKLFFNGVKKNDNAWGAVATNSATSSMVIGGEPQAAGPASCGGTSLLGMFWIRELAEAEMAALDADPYGFFVPAEGSMPALMPMIPPLNLMPQVLT